MSIAIVSVGIRFPGSRTIQEYWQHILAGRDLVQPIMEGRWPHGSATMQRQGPDSILHDAVYQLDQTAESSLGLEISPELFHQLDPLFHLALGAGRDAFYASRHQAIDRQRCGIILGNIALPTASSARLVTDWLRPYLGQASPASHLAMGNQTPAALPASVLARALGFGGGAFTLDAACASSLYAIKFACDALEAGKLDCILAGGLSRPDSLYTQVGFTALQALSKSGRCQALDAGADGLLVGEGAGIFVLKRLADAEAAGDTIWAVIRGAGLTNDREGRLMAPSSEGQVRAMRQAYAEAKWKPEDVQFIECHATGTPLGDRTEWESLCTLWAEAPQAAKCTLGSVKPNVGHMLTAAGAAGLAKLLIAMREGQLPPTANYINAPVAWRIQDSHFQILTTPEAWPLLQGTRRAAISGFGFGGINAHLLLETYQPKSSPAKPVALKKRSVALVASSALGVEDSSFLAKISSPLAGTAFALDAFQTVQIPYSLLRIPPSELKEMLPQQLYSLLALKRLNLPNFDTATLAKAACFVGLELDPTANLYASRWALPRATAHASAHGEAQLDSLAPALNAERVIGALGSIVSSRVARELRFGGPSFTVSALENSGIKALELAMQTIERGEAAVALVLAVDMLGSAVAAAQITESMAAGDLDADSASDGAVAMLLVDADFAKEHNLPILARLQSVGLAGTLDAESGLAPELIEASSFLPDKKIPTEVWAAKGRAQLANAWRSLGYIPLDSSALPYQGSAQALALLFAALKAKNWQSGTTRQWLIKGRDSQLGWMRWERGEDKVSLQGFGAESGISLPRLDLKPLRSVAVDSPQQIKSADDRGGVSHKPRFAESPAHLVKHILDLEKLSIASHLEFLRFRLEGDALMAAMLAPGTDHVAPLPAPQTLPPPAFPLFDYAACKEFARGSIAHVFGQDFASIDAFPSRVRLPDERLLLCHRVMSLEGEARSMTGGEIVTEHDVVDGAWYLDDGLMPTSIAVEAGQADLMLAAWLGTDFKTLGKSVYRLLDAKVTFHRGLPRVGSVVRYSIRIKRFFEQSGILFFHFGFEATVAGEALLTMTDGCAGFFTEAALAAGRGVQRSQLQLHPGPGRWTGDFEPLVAVSQESYSATQLDALRLGHYQTCFGAAFNPIFTAKPKGLPGGDMRLVHRIINLEPRGGRFGLGLIVGEADIHADDWFLTCHFIDDQVMPGTLMFECCLHTLRIFLMRMGWVGAEGELSFEPMSGVSSQLKCRGQVLPHTRLVRYEIEIKEMGYGPAPYVLADALMFADAKAIVDITDMSLHLPGLCRQDFVQLWPQKKSEIAYNYQNILSFSSGKPSDCFGPSYEVFDTVRRIARLPRPPLQFLDQIDWVKGTLMQQQVGTELLATYTPPDAAWYWDAEGSGRMPFAVLLEIALQPCGFMAAYMGSALLSERDLSFRNLSGSAEVKQSIRRGIGPLLTWVRCTKIARSGDMIIQDYDFIVRHQQDIVYQGTTSFGYFTPEALDQQLGLRHEARLSELPLPEKAYPIGKNWPRSPLLMVERWSHSQELGRYGLGVILGFSSVPVDSWFYEAHFYQDPVMPGSLGLEGLLQTLKAAAGNLWPDVAGWVGLSQGQHSWIYRGQVKPGLAKLHYVLHIQQADHDAKKLVADGLLYCNDLPIYEIKGLGVEAQS